ncbi:methyltransferase domain-containing protein [Actinotalea soli]|nr:methyltransferase domain-containing protein [Actinotalea soli]
MPPTYVLFPGRHHLVTRFQVERLAEILATGAAPAASVIWAVTSATHHGTRRNPLPAHRREAIIERVAAATGLPSLVAPVADVAPSDRFATTVLASVGLTLGLELTPESTVVACSTPEVTALYEAAGFVVLPVEDDRDPQPARPWDVLEMLVAQDERWRELVHPAAAEVYDRYGLASYVRDVHEDPTVSSEGDLTETRDYRTYTAAFDDASDRKWEQVGPFVRPGRVVDLGCAAGGLLERAARDPRLADSDLYGVDVSRHLVAEAEHRRAQGVFGHPNVFFAQRNLLHAPVFSPGSVTTTTTIALTHEISSYGDGVADLRLLARRIFEHTAPGGVWINSDVLGPQDGDRLVHLHLGGAATEEAVDLERLLSEEVAAFLEGLAPAQRLEQFARDFPALSGGRCDLRWVADGVAELPLRHAMEFLYTRDYLDNYLSECHERFCDMSYDAWVELLEEVGFTLDPGSGPWRNEWLVENRLEVRTRLTDAATGEPVPWPDTHVLFAARRVH